MKTRTTLLLGALAFTALAMAVAGPAAAQATAVDPAEQARRFPKTPTETTLFFHINGFQEFPINTQAPDDRFKADGAFGILATSNDCLDDLTDGALGANGAMLNQDFHTIYGYISPSYVEYDKNEGGKPRIHQERGISYDVEMVGSEFTLYWYLQTHYASGRPAVPVNDLPAVVPNVVVMATMRAGDAISVGNEAYNDGPVLAQGYSGPFTLAGEQTSTVNGAAASPSTTFPPQGNVTYLLPAETGGAHVYQFAVPMKIEAPTIPRDDGANLRIDVFIENPACTDPTAGYAMTNQVRIHSSQAARPRMVMTVNNPIMIPYLHPQFVAGDMVVHTQLNSPWGNYDVNEGPGGIEVAIQNLDQPAIKAQTIKQASFIQHALDHNKHQDAVDVTYLWDYEAEEAPDGVYEVVVKVWNDARTASAEGRSKFQIGKSDAGLPPCDPDLKPEEQVNCIPSSSPQGSKDSPGAGVAFVVVLALLGAALRRRL